MHPKNYVIVYTEVPTKAASEVKLQKLHAEAIRICAEGYTLKQSEFELKIDDQNLHLSEVNSDSEQEHNILSHQCAEASAAGQDERF